MTMIKCDACGTIAPKDTSPYAEVILRDRFGAVISLKHYCPKHMWGDPKSYHTCWITVFGEWP